LARPAEYGASVARQDELWPADLEQHVAERHCVAEVRPKLRERAGDEDGTVALPDVGIGVAGPAVGVSCRVTA
jgi:hypothetical protein